MIAAEVQIEICFILGNRYVYGDTVPAYCLF